MPDLSALLKSPQVVGEIETGGVQRLDYELDMLRLIGQVVALRTLLEVASSPVAEASAKVSAARALSQLAKDEDPEKTAERLRAAPFSDFTHEELSKLMTMVNEGKPLKEATDLIKQERDS